MSKSWKASVLQRPIYKNLLQKNKQKFFQLHAGNCLIVNDFLGSSFSIHNGKRFENVVVGEELLGHKLGSFRSTRVVCMHKLGKAKK